MGFNINEEEFFDELKENDSLISSRHGHCSDRHLSIPPSDEGITIIQNNECDLSAKNLSLDATPESKSCYAVVESSSFTVPSDMKV